MRRCMMLLTLVAGIAIPAWTLVAGAHDHRAPSPVYSVAAIDRQLRGDFPRRFHQPIWVRAIAEWCAFAMAHGQAAGERCLDRPPMLVDSTNGAAPPLPLVKAPVSALPTWLRWVPIVRGWLPRPPSPRWNQVAIYRVRVVQVPFDSLVCMRRPCYGARLLSIWA